MKYLETIADNLSKAGWSWGCVATMDREVVLAGGELFGSQAIFCCGLRLGSHSIANCWSPTIERWRLKRRRLAEGGISVKRLGFWNDRLVF